MSTEIGEVDSALGEYNAKLKVSTFCRSATVCRGRDGKVGDRLGVRLQACDSPKGSGDIVEVSISRYEAIELIKLLCEAIQK